MWLLLLEKPNILIVEVKNRTSMTKIFLDIKKSGDMKGTPKIFPKGFRALVTWVLNI